MYVKTFAGETLSVEVSLHQSFAELKCLLEKISGCPNQLQKICTYDITTNTYKEVENDRTLKSCNLKLDDTVNMYIKQGEKRAQLPKRGKGPFTAIFVKPTSGKTITLYISLNDQGIHAKQLIAEQLPQYASSNDEMILIHSGKRVEDFDVLRDCNVTECSTLHICYKVRGGGVSRSCQKLSINIEMTNKEMRSYNVLGTYTFGDLKRCIDQDQNIPRQKQILTFHGQKMDDETKLGNVNIKSGDAIVCRVKFDLIKTLKERFSVPSATEKSANKVCKYMNTLKLAPSNLRQYTYYHIFNLLSENMFHLRDDLAFVLLKKYWPDQSEYDSFITGIRRLGLTPQQYTFEILQQWKIRESGDDKELLNALRCLKSDAIELVEELLQQIPKINWQESLSDGNCHYISENIGHGWESIGLALGVNKARLEQLKENHRDVKTVIAFMLIEWKRNTEGSDKDKVEKLKDVLRQNGLAALTWEKYNWKCQENGIV